MSSNYIVEHIISHTNDCSLLLKKNGETLIKINEHSNRPLASIYKLIILFAYLEKCQSEEVDPNEQVHFNQLKSYWIRWIDPGFLSWYQALKESRKIKKDCVALKEVVQGMIQYSCNANTDYLLAKLGIDAVNEQLVIHNITNHDPVVPISTSVLVAIKEAAQNHTPVTLGKIAQESFELMKEGKKIEGLDLNLLNYFDYDMQCHWSDLLPHSSVSMYGEILVKIQELQSVHKEVQEVMNWFSKLKIYKKLNGGMKLGFTPKVFNTAMYIEDADGNNYQLIYFLNNLSEDQKQLIEYASNDFNIHMLKDSNFVNQLKNQLKNQVENVNIC